MKNKTIIIIGICILAIIIVVSLIFINKGKGSESDDSEPEPKAHLYTHQVIDIESLDTKLYDNSVVKLKKFSIASKYKVGNEAYTYNADIDMYLDGKMAKVIYIRDDDTKLNVVQLKSEITDSEEMPGAMQAEEFMRDFEMECKSNMGLMDLEKKPNEVNIGDENISLGEHVYTNKQLYSARYVVEDEHFTNEEYKEMGIDKSEYTKTYDINFYMDGENTLVCEFVRVL